MRDYIKIKDLIVLLAKKVKKVMPLHSIKECGASLGVS
jgi:hypothetical protein